MDPISQYRMSRIRYGAPPQPYDKPESLGDFYPLKKDVRQKIFRYAVGNRCFRLMEKYDYGRPTSVGKALPGTQQVFVINNNDGLRLKSTSRMMHAEVGRIICGVTYLQVETFGQPALKSLPLAILVPISRIVLPKLPNYRLNLRIMRNLRSVVFRSEKTLNDPNCLEEVAQGDIQQVGSHDWILQALGDWLKGAKFFPAIRRDLKVEVVAYVLINGTPQRDMQYAKVNLKTHTVISVQSVTSRSHYLSVMEREEGVLC